MVDDPEGYQSELLSDLPATEDKLDLWLIAGSERFRRDPALCKALLAVANHSDSRRCFLLIQDIIETPALLDRLFQVLRPDASLLATQPAHKKSAKRSTK